jgi:hypothetical protein
METTVGTTPKAAPVIPKLTKEESISMLKFFHEWDKLAAEAEREYPLPDNFIDIIKGRAQWNG